MVEVPLNQNFDHSRDQLGQHPAMRETPEDNGHLNELVDDLIVPQPHNSGSKKAGPGEGRVRLAQNFKSPPVAERRGVANELKELRLQKKLTKDDQPNLPRQPRRDNQRGSHYLDNRKATTKASLQNSHDPRARDSVSLHQKNKTMSNIAIIDRISERQNRME